MSGQSYGLRDLEPQQAMNALTRADAERSPADDRSPALLEGQRPPKLAQDKRANQPPAGLEQLRVALGASINRDRSALQWRNKPAAGWAGSLYRSRPVAWAPLSCPVGAPVDSVGCFTQSDARSWPALVTGFDHRQLASGEKPARRPGPADGHHSLAPGRPCLGPLAQWKNTLSLHRSGRSLR